MEKTLESLQTIIFTDGFRLNNEYEKSELLLKIKEELGDLFDENPTIIPIPNDAPSEIPRIILNNKNASLSCNISLSKIELSSLFQKEKVAITKEVVDKHIEHSVKIFEFLKNLLTRYKKEVIIIDVKRMQ